MSSSDDGLTYEGAGVSVADKNKINAEIARILRDVFAMTADGLFGGAVDVSKSKGADRLFLNITGASFAAVQKDMFLAGERVATLAFEKCAGEPIGVLDYIASADTGMFVAEFVKGVARYSFSQDLTPVLGGENAQMTDTYERGKFDALVHVLSLSRKRSRYSTVDIADLINGMKQPILIASTDGTGTKTKINKSPDNVIKHGCNDVGVQGAKPIAFALYIAGNTCKFDLDGIESDAREIAAELDVAKTPSIIEKKPNVYLEGEVDIVGTVVGIVEKEDMITGKDVQDGHKTIGIASDGLMTNGYTLARRIVRGLIEKGVVEDWTSPVAELGGRSLEDELSRPHVRYTDILFGDEDAAGVLSAFKGQVKGMAHITGGGQPGNIPRMVPLGLKAVVQRDVLPVPPIMRYLIEHGAQREDAYRSLNMGVGLTLTVPVDAAESIKEYINENFRYALAFEGVERRAAIIGEIRQRREGEKRFEWGRLE